MPHLNLKLLLKSIGWLLGFFFLLWGLLSLQNIFRQERDDAFTEVKARQTVLSEYATQAFKQNLHRRAQLAEISVKSALRDPLVSDRGLLFFNQRRQLLPRPVEYQRRDRNTAIELYRYIKAVDPIDLAFESMGPWEQRLRLLSDFKVAVEAQDANEIRWAFRFLREHRAEVYVEPEKDIAFMLAVLEYFLAHSEPAKSLLQGIIRNGSIVEQEQNVDGLQRALLVNRNRFTHEEFVFFAAKIVELSKILGIEYSDFEQQSESSSELIDIDDIGDASIDFAGQWYVEPLNDTELLGLSVDLTQVVNEVENEMRFLTLLDENDTINLNVTNGGPIAVNGLNISIQSTSVPLRIDSINHNYLVKTSLLITTTFLVIIIFALTLLIHYRHQRFLKLKTEFISTVSHELKTPLASISLLAETLQRRAHGNEALRDYPHRIINVVNELRLLIENILSFNRLTKGGWKPNTTLVHIHDLLSAISHEYKQYTQNPPDIIVHDSEDMELQADPELIKILFRNLVSNSCKYNNNKNIKIEIKAVREPYLSLYFSDNGFGIPKNQWNLVFKEFARYVKNKERSIVGTGLGLAICQKIMHLHGGTVAVHASDDSGTTFRLSFSTSRVN